MTLAPPSLSDSYDGLLVDLDGTLYRGAEVVPGARESLESVALPVIYVTNNASRSPDETAAHLADLGIRAEARDVMTSAQAAVEMATRLRPPAESALVVGAESFRDLACAAGLRVVRSAAEQPDVVLQGLSMDLGWKDLAEGCLAIRAGARWIASNVDTTLPAERGLLPGNGALVAALRAATDREPLVAGKPAPGALEAAAVRLGSTRPLVVGDRLDTDVAGAVAASMDCLMVLTGVSSVADLLGAPAAQRPTHLAADMNALLRPAEESAITRAPGLSYRVDGDALVVDSAALGGIPLARSVLAAAWEIDARRVVASSDDVLRGLRSAGLPVG